MKTWPDNNFILLSERRADPAIEVLVNLKMISEMSRNPDTGNYILFFTDRDHSVVVDEADYHRVLVALGIED